MSRWIEVLKVHPIHETISWLEKSISTEFDDLDENEVTERRRFHKIMEKFKYALERIDPEVLPFSQLDALNKTLRHPNTANQVNAYVNSGSINNLIAINDQISNQLAPLSILVSLCEKEDESNPIRNLEGQVDQAINILISKKDKLIKDVETVSQQCNSQEEKLSSLEKDVETKSNELSTLTSEWQNQFSTAQDARSQEFSKWRDTFSAEKGKEVSELVNSYDANLKEGKSNFDNNINEMLGDGKSKHESILELYELTAGDSVGAGYIKSASDEMKQANLWRVMSLGFIVATVVWLMCAYFNSASNISLGEDSPVEVLAKNSKVLTEGSKSTSNLEITKVLQSIGQPNDFPWHRILMAFSISGVFLWGAAYSAQQSTKHRQNEKRARWFALEIKAFDPFISTLDKEQQKELKKQLAERIFGQSSSKPEDEAKVIDEHAFKLVTNSIGAILSKLPK